jgi:hypothetical protein
VLLEILVNMPTELGFVSFVRLLELSRARGQCPVLEGLGGKPVEHLPVLQRVARRVDEGRSADGRWVSKILLLVDWHKYHGPVRKCLLTEPSTHV